MLTNHCRDHHPTSPHPRQLAVERRNKEITKDLRFDLAGAMIAYGIIRIEATRNKDQIYFKYGTLARCPKCFLHRVDSAHVSKLRWLCASPVLPLSFSYPCLTGCAILVLI